MKVKELIEELSELEAKNRLKETLSKKFQLAFESPSHDMPKDLGLFLAGSFLLTAGLIDSKLSSDQKQLVVSLGREYLTEALLLNTEKTNEG